MGFNQWLLCDEKYEKFFSWIGNNITNDNILTELELMEYVLFHLNYYITFQFVTYHT